MGFFVTTTYRSVVHPSFPCRAVIESKSSNELTETLADFPFSKVCLFLETRQCFQHGCQRPLLTYGYVEPLGRCEWHLHLECSMLQLLNTMFRRFVPLCNPRTFSTLHRDLHMYDALYLCYWRLSSLSLSFLLDRPPARINLITTTSEREQAGHVFANALHSFHNTYTLSDFNDKCMYELRNLIATRPRYLIIQSFGGTLPAHLSFSAFHLNFGCNPARWEEFYKIREAESCSPATFEVGCRVFRV